MLPGFVSKDVCYQTSCPKCSLVPQLPTPNPPLSMRLVFITAQRKEVLRAQRASEIRPEYRLDLSDGIKAFKFHILHLTVNAKCSTLTS